MEPERVDIKFLTEQMQKLKIVYGDKMKLDNAVVGVWYEQFGGCRRDWFLKAVKQHIANSQYAPLPANIWEHYRECEENENVYMQALRTEYNALCSRYPGGTKADDNCKLEFYRVVDGDIDKAKMLVEHTEAVVRAMEKSGEYISLLEYLKGL